MKLRKFIETLLKIEELEKIKNPHHDPKVIIDCDENGYYRLERVFITKDLGETFVNLKSSNEC